MYNQLNRSVYSFDICFGNRLPQRDTHYHEDGASRWLVTLLVMLLAKIHEHPLYSLSTFSSPPSERACAQDVDGP